MDNIKFSYDTWCSKHTISGLPLCEEETGRVVAVFYNDYEAEYVIESVNSHDALTARVAELESKTKWLCPDSNPPEKDFEVITCSDDDVGLSTYRQNQDGSHYFDGMANVSGWMPKPEALEDES
jgi:hypothetical protein